MFKIISKRHGIIPWCPVFLPPKTLSILAKDSLKIEIELLPECTSSHQN